MRRTARRSACGCSRRRIHSRGAPEQVETDRDDDEGGVVDERGSPLTVVAKVLRDQRGRKRHNGDAHQQQPVEEQQPRIRSTHEGEDAVMVHPHDQDRHEAAGKRDVGGPLREERAGQRPPVRQVSRHFQIQDEQGDRDREHAVAERLDACRFTRRHHRPAGGFPPASTSAYRGGRHARIHPSCARARDDAVRIDHEGIVSALYAARHPPFGEDRVFDRVGRLQQDCRSSQTSSP